MKAIITDDESKARTLLQNLLQEYCPTIHVVAYCEDIPKTVKAIHKEQPELVFLDVEMPHYSGLELLDFFNDDSINFDIIFTTAYNQYAIQAIKMQAFDYLLKPIHPDELMVSVNRLQRKYALQKTLQNDNLLYQKHTKKLQINMNGSVQFINLDEILYLRSDRAYTDIHTFNHTYTASKNLKYFEEQLQNDSNFFRCHKSFLINLRFVKEYNRSEGGYALLMNNTKIPISPEKVLLLIDKLSL